MNNELPQDWGRSPIGNARRIITYDDQGRVIRVEWELLPSAAPAAAAALPPDDPPALRDAA